MKPNTDRRARAIQLWTGKKYSCFSIENYRELDGSLNLGRIIVDRERIKKQIGVLTKYGRCNCPYCARERKEDKEYTLNTHFYKVKRQQPLFDIETELDQYFNCG